MTNEWDHLCDELARLKAIANKFKWRPMDSAPKDAWILAYYPDIGISIVRWSIGKGQWVGDSYYFYEDETSQPTHWMPLPGPPKK